MKSLQKLKKLELDLSQTQITDKTVDVFSGGVMPRLV